MSSSRGLKKMASSDCSLESMEIDIRASRHAVSNNNNLEVTMDLSTRRRNRNSDSSVVQSQPADLSGHRRNSMDTLPIGDQRCRGERALNNNNSVPSRSRPNSVGGTRYSAELSNHRRQNHRSSNSNISAAIMQSSAAQQRSSDVIVLSDEDAPRINGHVNGFSTDSHPDSPESDLPEPLSTSNRAQTSKVARLAPEDRVKKELSLRRLQEELRNEEMKLVLLKKLRQSQSVKETLITPPTSAAVQQTPVATSTGKMTGTGGGRTSSPQNSSVSVSNSLLSRSTSKIHSQQSHQSLLQPLNQSQSQSMGSGGSRSGSNSLPPSIMLQQNMLRNSGLLGRPPVTTPPNVVMGYPMQSSQGSKTNASQNNSNSAQQPSSTSSPTPQQISGQLAQAERIETQTPAQRQAAAKLALRKQLEKTLLQIPPPKPPPPEMHFIPNANNQEFVYLVGLEVVVGLLVGDERCNKPPPDPFTCVQCATDFTPVWKWQDAGEKKKPPAVICESCVTTNIKKALKAEHTNRLKTAFVKALQQEQEIEQRMSQGSTSPPLPISTPPPPVITTSSASSGATLSSTINHRASTPPNSRSPIPTSFNRSGGGLGGLGNSSAAAANAVAAAVANSAALLQQMPKLTAAHQSLLQAQHLQQLAQSLPGHQPQPAHGLPFGPLLAAQAYSYQMLGKSSLSSTERQYLLDMIPPRSMSQNSMNWKT